MAEVERLREVKIPTAVCHGFRQTWGIQTIKKMLLAGELGQLIALEGRYWQSSAAQKALSPSSQASWKNDNAISGDFDSYLDLGTHWVDSAIFLLGQKPQSTCAWLSYANAEAPHRDNHIHLQMKFPDQVRAMASISKTMHGANNFLEFVVLGKRGSATWNFLKPDEIELGIGSARKTVVRMDSNYGSKQPPFHALGWLEGYIEIVYQSILGLDGKNTSSFPSLPDHLDVLTALLTAEIER